MTRNPKAVTKTGPLKIGMPFEDALRHILSVGPMPKVTKATKATTAPGSRKAGQKKR